MDQHTHMCLAHRRLWLCLCCALAASLGPAPWVPMGLGRAALHQCTCCRPRHRALHQCTCCRPRHGALH